ncbi:DUF2509 family protein [Martelella alba]|uniref:DUF2509 family protein n=1 Tax=Martelella alba TaxID=2590451 RepID=A0ABY2SM42_9HYPH|nr:DUF2509 family protein [Martelella alba]TKI05930.1 DUF2509 family protein [Martelella alba]
MNSEQGGGTLAAIMGLLLLGMTTLLVWQRTQSAWRDILRDEQQYLTAFHRAESALSWGMSQYWRGDDAPLAQCRRPIGEPFRACLVVSGAGEGWLLRGESGDPDERTGDITLYRRVAPRLADKGTAGERLYVLDAVVRGWQDYPAG